MLQSALLQGNNLSRITKRTPHFLSNYQFSSQNNINPDATKELKLKITTNILSKCSSPSLPSHHPTFTLAILNLYCVLLIPSLFRALQFWPVSGCLFLTVADASGLERERRRALRFPGDISPLGLPAAAVTGPSSALPNEKKKREEKKKKNLMRSFRVNRVTNNISCTTVLQDNRSHK